MNFRDIILYIPFDMAIVVYLSFWVAGIFLLWLFEITRSTSYEGPRIDQECIWHCKICGYTYFNYHKEDLTICPVCNSYNKKKKRD